MMGVRNLKISGCEFRFDRTLFANDSMTFDSASVIVPELRTGDLSMNGGIIDTEDVYLRGVFADP